MITISIDILPYLAEYAMGKFYDSDVGCVRFPPNLDVYVLIYDLTQRRPKDAPQVDRGNFTFVLPDRKVANQAGGKSPEVYNYISKRSAKVIEAKLRTMMWAEVHEYMDEQKHRHGMQLKESAYLFLLRYDIRSLTEDAVLKNYQRWRNRCRSRAKRPYHWKS